MTSDMRARVPSHLSDSGLHNSFPKTPEAPARLVYDFEVLSPHCRLQHKTSLRTKLKHLRRRSHPPDKQKQGTAQRLRMRMRESDDYITARGANPRTGLISPSVGCPSPGTPGTIREALAMRSVSPTPDTRATGAALATGGERKTSGSRWRQDERGWFTVPTVASPRTSTPASRSTQASSSMNEDAFVCHMPSAAEPQPYAYPGQTAAQIEAFEHSKWKTRLASNEGCQQRDMSNSSDAGQKRFVQAQHALRACSGNAMLVRRGATVVRCANSNSKKPNMATFDEGDVTTSTFAPFRSPHTPARTRRSLGSMETALRTILGVFDSSVPDFSSHSAHSIPHNAATSLVQGTVISRKQLGSPAEHPAQGPRALLSFPVAVSAASDHARRGNVAGVSIVSSDIRQLPRMRLVHPQLASLPEALRAVSSCTTPPDAALDAGRADYAAAAGPGGRLGKARCCLECLPSEDRVMCEQARRVLSGTPDPTPGSMLETEPSPSDKPVSDAVETLSIDVDTCLTVAAELLKRLPTVKYPRPPSLASLDALFSPDASLLEKANAVKAVLAIIGHAIVFLTVTTVFWRTGRAVGQVLEALLWPLMVPLRTLRWMLEG